jgi:P-type conjugative transfer protein TrbJ
MAMSRRAFWSAVVGLLLCAPVVARAQIAVVDPTNLVQNTLTAVNSVQVVLNTIQQIAQLQAQIQNQLQTLKSIDPKTIAGLQQLISAGQLTFGLISDDASVIKYNLAQVNGGFGRLFPKTQAGWAAVKYSDFNGHYDSWNAELIVSALAASRAQTALVTLDGNNQAIQTILASSRDATGEVRQLQLVNQQLAVIHAELASLVQNLTTMSRVLSNWAAAGAGESMMARERSRRRLDGYTTKGKPPKVLTKLP